MLAYTLSKCMDNGSNQRDVIPDAYDASFLWGPCDYDVRNILLIINFIYQCRSSATPAARSPKALLGGWQVTGVFQFQTGQPFKVQTSDDFAGIGPGSGNQISVLLEVRQLRPGSRLSASSSRPAAIADPAQYLTVKDSSGALCSPLPQPAPWSRTASATTSTTRRSTT